MEAYHVEWVDIRASGFWRYVFTPPHLLRCSCFAASNHSTTLVATFCKHEAEKHLTYEECVHEVEHGSFIPLIFSELGGMGKAATTTYKHLACLLSEKWSSPVMGWLHCNFGILLALLVNHVHQELSVSIQASWHAHSSRSCRSWGAPVCSLIPRQL